MKNAPFLSPLCSLLGSLRYRKEHTCVDPEPPWRTRTLLRGRTLPPLNRATSAFETGRRMDTDHKYVVILVVRRCVSVGHLQGSQSSLDEVSHTDMDKINQEEELGGRKRYEILILEMGNRAYWKSGSQT